MAKPSDDQVTVILPRTEALALVKVADVGLRVVEALGLIQNPASAERGLNALNAAASRPAGPRPSGSGAKRRPRPPAKR